MLSGQHTIMYEYFWKIKTLPSTEVVAWRVLQNRVATKDNLLERGMVMDSTLRIMCGEEEETRHLLG